MKRTAISLMMAFSFISGLTACGTDQTDSSEAPITEGDVAAQACPDGYYYCPTTGNVPADRHYYCGSSEVTLARVECLEYCNYVECIRVTL